MTERKPPSPRDPAMIPGESSPAQRAPDHDRDQVPAASDAENLGRHEHAEMADAIERERDA